MRFPSVRDVARYLQDLNANVEGETDVRLQVLPPEVGLRWANTPQWQIWYGDSSYDLDHRGYWASGTIPGVVRGRVRRLNATSLARELLREAKDDWYQSDEYRRSKSYRASVQVKLGSKWITVYPCRIKKHNHSPKEAIECALVRRDQAIERRKG